MNKPPSQKGRKRSKETIEKLRLSHLGKKPSKATRKKMSETHKRIGTGKWMIGKKHSEVTKKKMSESHKGMKNGLGAVRSEAHKEAIRKAQKGKNNVNWKGGITPEHLKIRASSKYREWRKKVFQRDNYTCQKYKTIGRKLHPHHIKNFAEHPKLRFVVSNGITLSEKAHMEFHKKYGRKNNTRAQLKEFLSWN